MGYPAWAGIDRRGLPAERGILRLPRVGGDRPRIGKGAAATSAVTPRGRG